MAPAQRGIEEMRVTVVGLGYVGLVTGACLAEWGHDVVGVDADPRRLDTLREGRVPFHEPRLPELVADGDQHGHADASPTISRARPPRPTWSSSPSAPTTGTVAGRPTRSAAPWPTSSRHGRQRHAGRSARRLPPDFIRQLPSLVASRRTTAERSLDPGHAQPGVHPGGAGRPRLPAARPHRPRRRQRPGWARRGGTPRALPLGRSADRRHGRDRRRDHEARSEPLPRDEDQLRQRACRDLRRLRRGCRDGRRRHVV